MSQLDQLIGILRTADYIKVEDGDDPHELGHKEFFVVNTLTKTILAIGQGFSGDDGCFTNFIFSHDGKLENHGSICESEDSD